MSFSIYLGVFITIFGEAGKLIFLFINLIKLAWQAIVAKSPFARRFLTEIYLQLLYLKSQIPDEEVMPRYSYEMILSHQRAIDGCRQMGERFSLMSDKELFTLLVLLKNTKPIVVFEFGLMRGGSLFHFIKNCPPETRFLSLDLSDENLDLGVRDLIKDLPNVEIVKGDSRKFDHRALINGVDFILVDGGHDYDVVKSDSEKALKMIRKGGVIVWDDYHPKYPGVFRYLNELFQSDRRLRHVPGTSFIFLIN